MNIAGSMDMWALGVVVTAVCGFRFTDVADEGEIQSAWTKYLGIPPNDAGFSIQPSQAANTTPKKELPHQLVSTLGDIGVDILTSFLMYKPLIRLTAADALDHRFLQEAAFPLMGVEYTDMPEHSGMPNGHGRHPDPLFTPDVVLNVNPRPPCRPRLRQDSRASVMISAYANVY